MRLRHRLEVNFTSAVENHVGNLRVQRIVDVGSKALLQLLRHESRGRGPLLQILSDKVVSKAFPLVFLVILLNLVVIGVEDYRQLDRLDVLLVDLVLTDTKLFNAEILLESSTHQGPTRFVDTAVIQVELDQGLVAQDQLGNVL